MKKLNHLPITLLFTTFVALLLSACAGPPEIQPTKLQADKIAFESYRDGQAEVYS